MSQRLRVFLQLLVSLVVCFAFLLYSEYRKYQAMPPEPETSIYPDSEPQHNWYCQLHRVCRREANARDLVAR